MSASHSGAVNPRRSEQELPDVGRLTIEYLFGQEISDEPVVAGELIDKGVWRLVAAQGQRGQAPATPCRASRALKSESSSVTPATVDTSVLTSDRL